MNDAKGTDRTPTQVLGMTLKRLYPQNPDVVLGREARTITEAFTEAGIVSVHRDRIVDLLNALDWRAESGDAEPYYQARHDLEMALRDV